MSDFSRRKFLKTGAAALAGITIAPSSILGMSHGHVSPTDKLNLAAVGIGGMGHANINNVKGYDVFGALHVVDVGMAHTADTYGCEVQFVGW